MKTLVSIDNLINIGILDNRILDNEEYFCFLFLLCVVVQLGSQLEKIIYMCIYLYMYIYLYTYVYIM